MSTLRHATSPGHADLEQGKYIAAVYPADPAYVSHARCLVVATLDDWGLTALADDAGLVVGELAANAVSQDPLAAAAGEILIRVSWPARRVVIEVGDHNPAVPPRPPRRVADTAESGRGLLISRALAYQLGWYGEGDWKIVWAALPVHDPSRHQLRPAA
jgi:anti-sigma regulatory factor (Ser/Thr protein kinase)